MVVTQKELQKPTKIKVTERGSMATRLAMNRIPMSVTIYGFSETSFGLYPELFNQ